MSRLARRTFLRGAGVCLALPMLNAMTGRSVAAAAKFPRRRLVAIDLGFGLLAGNLFPREAGRNYTLTTYLEALQEFRDDFTIISGTSHPDVDGGHHAAKSFLTAAPKPTSANFQNTISLDQFAAQEIGQQTRFSYLTLSTTPGRGLSYTRSGVEIPAEHRPSKLFERLFLEGKPDEKQRQIQRLKDRQSILDSVLGQARRIERNVGPEDRTRLDQYFTAVRQTEARLVKAQEWEHQPKPQVNVSPPRDIADSADVIGRAELLFDMIHLALQTDSSRLVTLYNPGVNAVPPVPGVTQDYHMLSHHGNDAERLAQLKIMELEQLRVLSRFLTKLRDSDEDGETLLDRTMVFFGSDLGNGSSHDNRNLPVILAGGGFRHGQHLAFDPKNNAPLPNLFVSMLQQLGLEVDRFASSTGTLSGLEVKRV